MNRIFLKAGIGLLALLTIVLVAAFWLDFGFLRGTVESRLSQSSGLDVKIDGPLSIRLGREVRISAADVRVSNPSWPGDTGLLTLERLDANAGIGDLLADTPRLRQLALAGLELKLERNQDMLGNWQGTKSEASQPGAAAPLLVEQLSITNSNIHFRSPQLDEPLAWDIELLEQAVAADGHFKTLINGTLGGRPVALELGGGPWSSIVSDGPASLSLSGTLGDIKLEGEGTFESLWSPVRPELSLTIEGPSFEELTKMLGVAGLGKGPLSVSIQSREEAQQLRFDARGTLGELRIQSTAFVDSLSDTSVANIDAQVSGPNFGRLMRLAGFTDWPESRFEAALKTELEHPRLQIQKLDLDVAGAHISLSGTVPALPLLSGAELNLAANGPALAPFAKVAAIEDVPPGPFSLSGRVFSADDRTDIDLDYRTTLANGSVNGTIGSGQLFEGTRLDITAGREDASKLGLALGFDGLPAAPWKFSTAMSIPDGRIYEVQSARFETRGLSAQMSGKLGRDSLRRDSDVQFSVQGARLADLQSMVEPGISLPEQPFEAGGKVVAIPEGWRLQGVSARVGEDRLELSGVLGSADDLSGTQLAIKARGANAARFLPADSSLRLPDGPFQLDSSLALKDGRVVLSGASFSSGSLVVQGSADVPWPLNSESGSFDLLVNSKDITTLIGGLGGLEFDPNPLDARARGRWRDGRIQFESGDFKAGQSTLSIQGTLDLPPDLTATNLQVSALSPDLSKLGTMSGQRWEPVALDLKSAFTGGQTTLTMSQFSGRLGDSTINGAFSVDFAPQIPNFDLKFSSTSLDLRPFQAEKKPPGEAQKTGKEEALLIPDFEFPAEALARAEGRFELRAEKVLMDNMTLQDTVIRGSVRNGVLDVGELSTAGYRGRLTSTLKLSPLAGGSSRLVSTMRSEGLVLNLSKQPKAEKEQLPAFDIDISVSGDGAGLRQVAAGMNGKIRIGSEGGRVPNIKAKSASGLFLSEVLSTISPSAARQDHIQISCFAASADIANGIVGLDPGIAVQSEKLNIFMTGKINLANEKLDASLRTETRKTLDVSASELVSPYVKLSGTLSKPSLKIDTKGTLLSGGAAYLSGGLSILAKKALDQLGGTGNPCDGYLGEKAAGKTP